MYNGHAWRRFVVQLAQGATLSEWLQGFADRTGISWWIFALSGVGMLLAAMLTSAFQTAKAAIANPANSLRSA